MAIDINGDGLIQLGGTSTTQGRVRLNEDTDNGTNYVELTSNASITTNRTVTFPDADINFVTGLGAAQGGTGLTSAGTSGNVLTSNGTAWVSQAAAAGGGDYVMTVFTSPGTWTKPAGLKAVKVTVVGGGGGGGPAGTPSSNFAAGAGGGGGGASIRYLDAPAIPGPQPVTRGAGGTAAGAGGTSSFGAFASATGGSAGAPGPSAYLPVGGAGGVGSSGDLNIGGSGGEIGRQSTDTVSCGTVFYYMTAGNGGSSILGGGARNSATLNQYTYGAAGTGTNGSTGENYGGGGSGAIRGGGPAFGTNTGGAGANGVVIVEEFY